jgi:hypothetical protein
MAHNFINSPRTIHGRTSKMDTIEQKSGKSNADKFKRHDSKWEILTSLEVGTPYTIKPKRLEGILTKRRKWPLKGWHKRYRVSHNTWDYKNCLGRPGT